MPVTFDDQTSLYSGTIAPDETLPGFDFSIFGGMITNSGIVDGPITGSGDAPVSITNGINAYITKAGGSSFAIDLQGSGPVTVVNAYVILGHVSLGSGNDHFTNTDYVQGSVRMGAGDDVLENTFLDLPDGGPFVGQISGGIRMGDGNDTVINNGTLTDVLLGSGDDFYYVETAVRTTGLALGSDAGIAKAVKGGSGNDQLSGGFWNDQLFGGDDNDVIGGNGGNDKLYGDSGLDTLYGGDGNDKMYGGDGDDHIFGEYGNDQIWGGAGTEYVFGDAGNDRIYGGAGDDLLSGDDGHDSINGGVGNDRIDGGEGRDTLTGGSGSDSFEFRTNTGRDVITDFEEGDTIFLNIPVESIYGYEDILAQTSFVNGNAIIDLSAIVNATLEYGPDTHGAELTLLNVDETMLTEDVFASPYVY